MCWMALLWRGWGGCTITGTPGFMFLIKEPNHKLWIELKVNEATCCTYIFLGLEYFNDGILRKSLSLSATNVKSKFKAVAAIIASAILSL